MFELKPGVDPASVNKQFVWVYTETGTFFYIVSPILWSMNDWHLYDDFDNGKATGGGQIEYVRLFSIIAWIILFIACINFMNLATARSEKRAREVGVRKVLGARQTEPGFHTIAHWSYSCFPVCDVGGSDYFACYCGLQYTCSKEPLAGFKQSGAYRPALWL